MSSGTEQEVVRDAIGRALVRDRAADIYARGKSSSRWPQPWPHLGPSVDWYGEARERAPDDVQSEEAQAALSYLEGIVKQHPEVYFIRFTVERVLTEDFAISHRTARTLLQSVPGATLIEGVLCSIAAAPRWHLFKGKVYATLKTDALLRFSEVLGAVGADAHADSVYAAVCVLAESGVAVCIREREASADDGAPPLLVCRARRCGPDADYLDLVAAHRARTGRAPQAAA